ncbi:MAG: transglycosylase SLT domain-containing protein [Chromatiaceae bacterium]|nr:transglycosylase SLT domain-containing protein [Gammaproteobacteria bacterium]MCP5317699.1 transglycosylase SLT domain-containing protein [Chromatiaceae bacterium]MCW5585781.1 transglycosylase SLT domain-containing protein [Chromatiales bacterium]MCP5429284.1 transglycosylase SLT domain-containing protein [Chromatiaceae bacterium]MCP5434829.1 transglycosylase SLT domain-containing protein [Chromatiaceae bacterium]
MVLKRRLYALSLLCCVVAGGSLATPLEDQRRTFLAAEKALDRGAMGDFNKLSRGIRDYPLYPYLEYDALLKRLGSASNAEVEQFIKNHESMPLSTWLRANWLDHLAARQRWTDYLAFYQPSRNTTRRCQQLQALIATGKAQQAYAEVPDIWLHGKSQPSACDPVFDAWTKAGHRTTDMTWQRIEKAMESGEWRLAEYLGRSLSNSDQVWLKRWVSLYRTPAHAREHERFSEAHPYREAMLSHAVRQLARWDGLEGLALWRDVKGRYPFSADQVQRTEHYIVRNLVRTPGDTAYDFIRSVEVGEKDILVHEARIRAAMLREDWPQVVSWIAALPQDERQDESWTYWLARALQGTGDTQAADALYRKTARERTYYGFLAADRIGSEYHLEHVETPVSAALINEIAGLDAVKRVKELFALDRWGQAHSEWRAATAGMDNTRLQAAAKLAEQEGWHDRAIFTLAQTGYWDDLVLRFPLQHATLVEENAKRHGIDIAWVFAVMRQESAFMSNARSHAGAMGLMQLMPATARSVAKTMLNRKPPRRSELLEPDINIALGSAYLKQMKGELGDSAVLATAAYNAGPHRVTRWLPERTMPADIWIELVPFDETRGYLRRVLAYTVIYEKRMGKTPTRLNERLHPVPPSISLLSGAQRDAPVISAR